MKIHCMLAGTALAALLTPTAPARAQTGVTSRPDPYHRQFVYFLPKTAVGATITQQISECPTGFGDDVKIPVITVIAINDKTFADPERAYVVDARAGFLSERSTKLALRPDGTLTSFNVSTKGQGGEVLSAAIKIASTVAGWSIAGLPLPVAAAAPASAGSLAAPANAPRKQPALRCRAAVSRALERLAEVRADIARLESRLIEDKGSTAVLDLLTRRRAEAEELTGTLSLSAGKGIRFSPVRNDFRSGPGQPMVQADVAEAPAYEKWFEAWDAGTSTYRDATAADIAGLQHDMPGRFGFHVALTVNEAMFRLLSGSPPVLLEPGRTPLSSDRFVFYRRPVRVMVSVVPCADTPHPVEGGGKTCTPDDNSPDDTQSSKAFALPQLSGLYSLSVGSGGLFGSREAKVEIDENGAPSALQYGSTPGGGEIAGVMDSGLTAATTIRDAPQATTQRKIDAIKAENEFAELLAKKEG